MRAFFHSLTDFLKRLFRRKPLATPQPETDLKQAYEHSHTLPGNASQKEVSTELKQLVYRATCQLRPSQRVHASRIGALLKQTDPSFSYEQYGFTKLIDLLQALPELVELEKVTPKADVTNQRPAPIYYVRTITDTTALITEGLQSFKNAPVQRHVANSEPYDDVSNPHGWVHWHSLKDAIAQNSPGFSAHKYGFNSFKIVLKNRPDLVEFHPDSHDYVRLVSEVKTSRSNKNKSAPKTTLVRPNLRNSTSTGSGYSTRTESLLKFSGLPLEVLHQKVGELAAIALPEPWYFGPKPPSDFAYPILKSYLRYTFVRLQHENKVLTSANQKYRAFNTGLLDMLLRPIYALFTCAETTTSPWTLDFCTAGEDYVGKTLVAEFSQLPIAANYFENADKAFYHLSAGTPTVDWQHVVKDNMARLPLPFLQRYAPAGFVPQSTQDMSTAEFYEYKHSFTQALEADPSGYRNIVSRLEEALGKTLRRTQINYTTAVPTYYPKINSIDLLLPMCLVNEHTVDLALVVRREPSGKYIGHTILTLRQAYNNARLICKLNEHWLPRAMALSQNA
ncbi:MAG: DUF3825 domain-containing protein [Phormidesmis sp.]